MLRELPRLQELGWVVTVPEDFRHRITVVDSVLWDVQPDDTGAGWLDVALDIEIDGQTVPLAPMLAQLLQTDPRWTRGALDAIDDEERIRVGTLYKQVNAFEAKKRGAAIAARNIAAHTAQPDDSQLHEPMLPFRNG